MIFNVPQYIDIEDKIVGPFTWKQLGWFALLGVILMILWKILEFSFFIISGIPITIIILAFALYKPYGLTLSKMVYFTTLYLFNSKLYTWQRSTRIQRKKKPIQKKADISKDAVEVITLDELENLANILDNPDSLSSDHDEKKLKM
jgi:hypothetical protein